MAYAGDPAAGRAEVLASYDEAIAAVSALSPGVEMWDAPTPCAGWTVLDLAGHLAAVTRYWLRLLAAAVDGRPFADLPTAGALAAMNAADLRGLPERDGSERIARFVELATEHRHRLAAADWELVCGTWSGMGTLTVGQHTGVAIGEWHVHAWDLARALGGDHRPSGPELVQRGQHALFRATADGDPWVAVLAGYGRDPGWRPPGAS